MPLNARLVVERVELEQMMNAGSMNGLLIVTYDDFASYGIRRRSIKEAIEIAKALGWIDVAEQGGRSYGRVRRPAKYALTCLPRYDGSPKTNRWEGIDRLSARRFVKSVRARSAHASGRQAVAPDTTPSEI